MITSYDITNWVTQIISAMNNHATFTQSGTMSIERGIKSAAETMEKIADSYIDEMAQSRKLRERELDLRERELEYQREENQSSPLNYQREETVEDYNPRKQALIHWDGHQWNEIADNKKQG